MDDLWLWEKLLQGLTPFLFLAGLRLIQVLLLELLGFKWFLLPLYLLEVELLYLCGFVLFALSL